MTKAPNCRSLSMTRYGLNDFDCAWSNRCCRTSLAASRVWLTWPTNTMRC